MTINPTYYVYVIIYVSIQNGFVELWLWLYWANTGNQEHQGSPTMNIRNPIIDPNHASVGLHSQGADIRSWSQAPQCGTSGSSLQKCHAFSSLVSSSAN